MLLELHITAFRAAACLKRQGPTVFNLLSCLLQILKDIHSNSLKLPELPLSTTPEDLSASPLCGPAASSRGFHNIFLPVPRGTRPWHSALSPDLRGLPLF